MKKLTDILSNEDMACVCNSYDIVGSIAIIRLKETSEECRERIAEAIMHVHRNVKTVLAQSGAVEGNFRLRKLEYIGGENQTITVHKESGCRFAVDVERCFFSPRLSYERMRVARRIRDGEVVVNMFAGVGCFSIIIAKYSNVQKVYSIDVNLAAVYYMRENVRVNGVYEKVVPLLGDTKEIVDKRLRNVSDRVLMPLPEKALEYLPIAMLALKETGGWVHYYDFEHALKSENVVDKVKFKVSGRLKDLDVDFKIPSGHVVRATGPNWYQVVLDMEVSGFLADQWKHK
jgi:tRNA (guanine37-N1)-methyltransferase